MTREPAEQHDPDSVLPKERAAPQPAPAGEDRRLDAAARLLARLVTGGDDWDRKRDELRRDYREQVARILAAAGATLADDTPTPEVVVDAQAVHDSLAAIHDRIAGVERGVLALGEAASRARLARGNSNTARGEKSG